jgi:hypothetical protein
MHLYLNASKQAGFHISTKLYVASGLFSYASTSDVKLLQSLFSSYGPIVYKEKIISPHILLNFNPEQLAVIDFLVLSRSVHFVGLAPSTFSAFLR